MNDKLKVGGGYISQSIIVILYVAGMFFNYFLLGDIITREQYGRIKGEINFKISELYPTWDEAVSGKISFEDKYNEIVDTTKHHGTFSILYPDGKILFNNKGLTGNAFPGFKENYGTVARNVLAEQLKSPNEQGWIEYNDDFTLASYVRYDKTRNAIFFYQFNPFHVLNRVAKVYYLLLFIFLFGGVIIIFVCFMTIRKMNYRLQQEIASKRDISTAAAIQNTMLPKGERHLMQLDIAAKLVPAQGVGGDLYYYTLNKGKLYFCIGDVAGKGIAAAISMSRAVTLFHSMAEEELSPSRITSRMNVELCANNAQNIFITAIIGVMNVWDGKMLYCNAGHGRPLYWNGKPGSECYFIEGQGGLPLGFDESSQYEEYQVEFESNGMLMLFTDGINEARNKHKQLYGFDRLVAFAEKNKGRLAEEINAALLEDINRFADGANQSDDITLLTFRNIPRQKVLLLQNDIKELRKLPEFLNGIFKECPLDDKSRIKVRAALDEALTNCVLYAYPQSKGYIQLSASILNNSLVFVITDSGVAFNPVEYNSSLTGEIKIGGLGIAMVKSSFDDVQYERKEEKNVFKLIKNI